MAKKPIEIEIPETCDKCPLWDVEGEDCSKMLCQWVRIPNGVERMFCSIPGPDCPGAGKYVLVDKGEYERLIEADRVLSSLTHGGAGYDQPNKEDEKQLETDFECGLCGRVYPVKWRSACDDRVCRYCQYMDVADDPKNTDDEDFCEEDE